MLDLKLIIDKTSEIENALASRGAKANLQDVVELDKKRREMIIKVEALKQERNEKSKLVGKIKKEGGNPSEIITSMGSIGDEIKAWDAELKNIGEEITKIVEVLPNLPHETTPRSLNPDDKQIIRVWGEKPQFDFKIKNHVELAREHDIIDFEAGGRVAGSNFVVYKGMGAHLEFALINYMIDMNTVKGSYELIIPPVVVNTQTFYASGQLPKFEEQAYKCRDDDLYLIPTSETVLCGLHREQILDDEQLPIRYCAFTPCFRREAGTYGADERGLIRIHQFNKVEIFKITRPEDSYQELENMLADAERVIQSFGLHYRVTLLVSGDLGQQAAKTYDIEVWLPGQNGYKEISSVSNCEDYQARRGNIRYREKSTKRVRFVHTLNGSALATPRLMVALLEQNQQKDGSITIPAVLREYLSNREYI